MFRVWLAIMFTISTQDPVHGVLLRKITFLIVPCIACYCVYSNHSWSRVLRATVFYAITNDPGYGVSFCSMWFLEPMYDVFFSLFRVTTHDFLNFLLMWPLILIVMNACYFSIMYFGWSQLDALSLVYTLTLPRHNLDNAIITVCNSFLLICNYVLRWPL